MQKPGIRKMLLCFKGIFPWHIWPRGVFWHWDVLSWGHLSQYPFMHSNIAPIRIELTTNLGSPHLENGLCLCAFVACVISLKFWTVSLLTVWIYILSLLSTVTSVCYRASRQRTRKLQTTITWWTWWQRWRLFLNAASARRSPISLLLLWSRRRHRRSLATISAIVPWISHRLATISVIVPWISRRLFSQLVFFTKCYFMKRFGCLLLI